MLYFPVGFRLTLAWIKLGCPGQLKAVKAFNDCNQCGQAAACPRRQACHPPPAKRGSASPSVPLAPQASLPHLEIPHLQPIANLDHLQRARRTGRDCYMPPRGRRGGASTSLRGCSSNLSARQVAASTVERPPTPCGLCLSPNAARWLAGQHERSRGKGANLN